LEEAIFLHQFGIGLLRDRHLKLSDSFNLTVKRQIREDTSFEAGFVMGFCFDFGVADGAGFVQPKTDMA
jgi:hypothetical protein